MQGGAGRRTVRVETNRTCNQGCAFCDRRQPNEDPAFVAAAGVRARLDEARAAAPAATLLLTGGEPGRRRDLASLVRHAAAKGAVGLETNATLIDGARARELAAAGLSLARVHLPALGAAYEAITRTPGSFVDFERGLGALLDAGLRVEFATPVVRANLADVPELAAWIAERSAGATWWLLAPHRGGDPDAHAPLAQAARSIEDAATAARRHGLDVRLDPHTPLAPCLFERPMRIAHLFSLTPGGRAREGYARSEECAACVVSDRCPGLPVHLEATPRPIASDRVRRRLSVISSVAEQVERELVQDEVTRPAGGAVRLARTVRVRFACNQACDFCFVSTHLPAPPEDGVRKAIVDAAERGALVVLSGGEPTLHPELPQLVALAKAHGASEVELQTNATRIDPALARALTDAGLDVAHVSLHAADASTSDRITGAPGTFEPTLRGLDALQEEQVRGRLQVRLSFVFCQQNIASFEEVIALAAARWPGTSIAVSFVAPSTDMVPRTRALVPRHSDVLPALARGVQRAATLGVTLSGLESMCGLPLCLVPPTLVDTDALPALPSDYMDSEREDADACRTCALADRCFGLRRGYAELWGTTELSPIVP